MESASLLALVHSISLGVAPVLAFLANWRDRTRPAILALAIMAIMFWFVSGCAMVLGSNQYVDLTVTMLLVGVVLVPLFGWGAYETQRKWLHNGLVTGAVLWAVEWGTAAIAMVTYLSK